jgi:hypothetical protein
MPELENDAEMPDFDTQTSSGERSQLPDQVEKQPE